MRDIKFRIWTGTSMESHQLLSISMKGQVWFDRGETGVTGVDSPLMQYTGLKDKNGVAEVYEGDIISANGLIIGNQYENPEILETGANLLIQGFGTKDWIDTHKKALEQGCNYA